MKRSFAGWLFTTIANLDGHSATQSRGWGDQQCGTSYALPGASRCTFTAEYTVCRIRSIVSSSFLLLLVRPGAPSSFLFLVVRHLLLLAFLLLLVRHLLLVAMHLFLVAIHAAQPSAKCRMIEAYYIDSVGVYMVAVMHERPAC